MFIKLNNEDLLLKAIYEHIEEESAKEPPRGYIGASSIGNECELALWMQYKYPQYRKPTHAELTLAANDGHRSEALTAEYIRKQIIKYPDLQLITHDESGNQLGFSDLGGKFQGHWDGRILGLPAAPKTWHIWEHKAKNQNFYDKLIRLKENNDEKEVLKQWDYLYYCQAIVYMEYSGCIRHYMTVSTSGTRKYQSLRTNEDPKLAKLLRNKAERISKYIIPPIGISENPSFYKCKSFCDFSEKCPSINKNIIL